MKAGTNLETDVFPKMLHRNLYMEKDKKQVEEVQPITEIYI